MRHMLGGECSAVDATAEWVPDPSALDCPRCLELQSFSVEEPVLSMPIVRWPSSLPRPVAEVVRELHPGTHVDTDRELLRKALLALTPDAGETVYRWSLVRSALGHGSTIGNAICIAVGIDPDELVESPMPVWWKETEGEE